ncbi:MAG: chloride channel protein [Firmicutes bacterium]|nr:chloride channel protein [Bacillota bacterium]
MSLTGFSNNTKLALFCATLGMVSGGVLWIFLRLVSGGTRLIWDMIPAQAGSPAWYPVIACGFGGLVTGLFRKKFGDYPESMFEVMGRVKKAGTYPYRKIGIIMIAAMLPLIFGSSVGPEAGMVGIAAALGCWVKENVSFAGRNTAISSRLGLAVSLSVLFFSPLFGLFSAIEEDELPDEILDEIERGGSLKSGRIRLMVIYGASICGAVGVIYVLNSIFGRSSSGFPSFENAVPGRADLLMTVPYLIIGILLGLFFEKTELVMDKLSAKLPPVASELTAGIVLGLVSVWVPMVRFSGEEEMGILIRDYPDYAPWAMIAMAFLKIIITCMCIKLGMKGGHFFPLIFAAVCLGYGMSLLVFPLDSSSAVYAAAIVTAATLSATMGKPLAVTCLLFLCFPVRMGIWIFMAAFIASQAASGKGGRNDAAQ